MWGKFFLLPLVGGVFVIGDAGDAVLLPHVFEKSGAVAFAVEDEGEAAEPGVSLELLRGGLAGHVAQQARHDVLAQGGDEAGVHDLVDDEEGLAG